MGEPLTPHRTWVDPFDGETHCNWTEEQHAARAAAPSPEPGTWHRTHVRKGITVAGCVHCTPPAAAPSPDYKHVRTCPLHRRDPILTCACPPAGSMGNCAICHSPAPELAARLRERIEALPEVTIGGRADLGVGTIHGAVSRTAVLALLDSDTPGLDVERLRQAFMNTPTGKVRRKRIPTDDGSFWESVAAEYARLASKGDSDAG